MVLSSLYRLNAAPDETDEAAPPTRRLGVLCGTYLGLLLISLIIFWTGTQPDLVEAARDASTRLVTAQREQEAASVALSRLEALNLEAAGRDEEPLDATDDAVAAASRALKATDDVVATATRIDLEARHNVARGRARLAAFAAGMLIVAYFLVFSLRRLKTRQEVTNAATLMILLVGMVLLASRLLVQPALPGVNSVAYGIVDIVVMQLLACLIMPWTSREVTLPFAPLLVIWGGTFLLPTSSDLARIDRVVMIIMSALALVPGALIAGWRYRRALEDRERLQLGERMKFIGGELSRARIVHDAMFPDELVGHVHFEYEYQPIQEIGGDYVHLHECPHTGRVTQTLLDVAGHGLAAALTVNRLFGELERIRAENANAEPGEIMTLLNRYINLTMARHALYATGTCMSLDPRSGKLTWVSAGHPPSLLRYADGRVEELATTTMLLGALDSSEFTPGTCAITIAPGDTIIAFTDGAFEARDGDGHQFGLRRVRETARFTPPPRSWPKFIAGAVAQHHAGHADDDVLIAAMTLQSLRVGTDSVVRPAAHATTAHS